MAKHDAKSSLELFDTIWSVLERFGQVIGGLILIASGPVGHAIGKEIVGLYYGIPMAILGATIIAVGYRYRLRQETALSRAVKPLRMEFARERVQISELIEPGGSIQGLTFTECVIEGPAVLSPIGEHFGLVEPHYFGHPEAIFIALELGAKAPQGAIHVINCEFIRCRFHRISIACSADNIKSAVAGMKVDGKASWLADGAH